MHVSWNWLSEMVDLSSLKGPKGLADLLTFRGLEVEEIKSMSEGFDKVVTAQILERNPHPQADRLSLCKVSIGAGDPLEIVCGAQNMKAGDKVVLAQIGAHLPNGLKIAQGKIRGVVSNGMLCSEEELKLKDTSEGILILPADTQLGKPLAEFMGLDDTILTLKITANRADCFSHLGIAREVASALGQKVKRAKVASIDAAMKSCAVNVDISAVGADAPQFWGCLIDGVKIGPSPAWLVKRLESLGSRSINNVVDATNLVLFEMGHPTHAYDAKRIEGSVIRVRMSKEGEELPLLDGKSVTLSGAELVIADEKRAVGLAGVMGGGNSEVESGTTQIFLESAEFAPALVRRASKKYDRHTEAAHRFERGVDPMGPKAAIERLAQLVIELAGGTVKGAVAQTYSTRDMEKKPFMRQVRFNPTELASFLGMDLTAEQIQKTLESHECVVQKGGAEWTVVPPSYRLDIAIKEDLAEEVARSVGYDKIPATVPQLSSQPSPLKEEAASARAQVIERAKDALVDSGMCETVNFAFTSSAWLSQVGMTSTVKVVNPLSEEHEFMVPSLLPGLIHNALDNWRHHFGSEPLAIRLFELRPTYALPQGVTAISAQGEMNTGVEERWKLSMVLSGPRYANALRAEQGEVDFYDLKAVVESMLEALGSRGIRMSPLSASRTPDSALNKMFHPGQSVEILAGNTVAGVVGLMHPALSKSLKTRAPLWMVELDWDAIAKLSRSAAQVRTYKAWPEFPSMERDFALVVKDDISADKITQLALKAGKPLAKVVKVFDIYRGSQVPEGMTSVAVRVIFFEEGRSLQEPETEAASSRILESWKKELGADLRS